MALDIRLALMSGADIPVPELTLILRQPTIKEIALIGDTDFFSGVQCLNINKFMIDQGETLLANMNNFQIFMTIMTEKETASKKDAVIQLFQLVLPDYKIIFTPRSMILSNKEQNVSIDENNFEILSDILKQIFCVNTGPMDTQGFNPRDKKAKEIAEKLMRGRQRVAAQNHEGNGSILAQYVSMITVGVPSMSLEDCLNLTMYQLFDLVERYMLYINWDLDIRSRLAGGKPEGKTENWMKNIH